MGATRPALSSTPPKTLVRDWTSAYGWIPFAGGFISFALAVMAGANDVPTSFSASVGSGTLTLPQSVVLAFFMEIGGAVLLADRRIDGTQSSILKDMPDLDLMMWGFMMAMIAATIWLAVATFAEMPVTSILSIKGAIIGIALTTEGVKGIQWSKGAPRTSLHHISSKKAAVIAGSSAVLSVLLAYLIVVPLTRKHLACSQKRVNVISDKQDSVSSASQTIETEEDGYSEKKEITPEDLIREFNELRVLHTVYEEDEEEAVDQSSEVTVKCSPVCGPVRLPLRQLLAGTPVTFKRLRQKKKLTNQQKILKIFKKCRALTFDHKMEYNQNTLVRHALAEKFDERAEKMFSVLLIFAACATAFVHGSNDIPSLMGPYASILKIFKDHSVPSDEVMMSECDLNVWVLAVGGIGVSIGYTVLGWKLVECLGGRLSFLSPSRAFSAQICTVATALLASRTGLPVSITHIFIGAILGISIVDSIKNINWHLVGLFTVTWGLTFAFTSGIAMAIYSFTIFSPSVPVRP